jgi:hypothetical protein
MRENAIPKLREVIGGTKTKIHCQETVYRRCVLAVLHTITVDLTKFGNQKNYERILKRIVFFNNLEEMFKRTATHRDTSRQRRSKD